ncbi:hypothetical protein VCRA2123O444_290044 [Vibrio crassostreae]|nr:hypothetical protein VCRA2113O418_10482 [Vibrio crassostreae]CAK1951002.1 hypothetical protein VCRA2119O432_270044 [Vibrio crassostreae]CAK1952034.1 hypothetical protein VCRA2114O423_270044 [Vibrio crassostreae]CAK1952126.1 hypothetical protein VCRA2113O413_270044 [Vibrio crassostreae]CAK1955958.1 hypothetical protein VCRA2114O422_290017 [Vibrio crassostreae]
MRCESLFNCLLGYCTHEPVTLDPVLNIGFLIQLDMLNIHTQIASKPNKVDRYTEKGSKVASTSVISLMLRASTQNGFGALSGEKCHGVRFRLRRCWIF